MPQTMAREARDRRERRDPKLGVRSSEYLELRTSNLRPSRQFHVSRAAILLERGDASWNANDVREVDKPIVAGYRDFTDTLCVASDGCSPDSFPEGESRMKNAAA